MISDMFIELQGFFKFEPEVYYFIPLMTILIFNSTGSTEEKALKMIDLYDGGKAQDS